MSIPTSYSTFLVTTAPTAAYSFGETRASSEYLSPLPSVQRNPSLETPRSNDKLRRSISKEEWEILKPRIQRLYLDESQTFRSVARVLREEHGFEPTKDQFSRKVRQWRFPKYVSQFERRKLRPSLELEVNQQSIQDRRIGPDKLRNWKRRYRKEVNVKRCLGTQYLRVVTPVGQASKASIRTEEDVPPKSGMQDMPEAPPMIEKSNETSGKEDLGAFALQAESLDHSTWDFTLAAADVPGYPGVDQLINAIENEISDPGLPISLDTQDPEDSQCISGTEMLDLCNGSNKPLIYEIDTSCSSRLLRPVQAHLKGQTRVLPWRNPKFPFCRWSESPRNEIYIYPASPTIAVYQHPSSRKPLWARLESQAAELRSRISKMDSSFNADNPGIIPMKENLAAIYLSQGSYQKAEELCRYVERAMRKRFGPSSLETMVAGQNLARILQYQGRYLHAQTLLSKIRSRALKHTSPTHTIVTETTLQMAVIALDLDDNETTEGQLRQVLQILWETLGPRNYRTRMCIGEFGYALGKRGKYLEAEKLLHTALQLDYKFAAAGEEEDLCDTMRDLSLTLNSQGRYKESENVARRAVERFEESLGSAHPAILKARLRIARSLADQDQYQKSEDICRTIWEQQWKLLGESHPDTLSTVSLLAISLEEMGRLEEAAFWYEKLFRGDLHVYGPAGKSTISSCKWLGGCYVDQRRYDDATKLYQQLVEKIQAVKGDDHHAIAEIRGWIEEIKKITLEGEDNMREEELENISE